MDFLIGAVVATLVIFFIKNKMTHHDKITKFSIPTISQSRRFNMLKAGYLMMNVLEFKPKLETQATKHRESTYIKIAFLDDKAYWINSNVFYTANLVNGEIDKESTKMVDTMTMDKVELEKIIFIVEQLTEGSKNDSSDSGNK